jgi:hypothetical protein
MAPACHKGASLSETRLDPHVVGDAGLVVLAPLPSQDANGSAYTMTQATIGGDEAGIRETMAAYNAALNGGKTAAVLSLYTEDGVLMPPYSQSAVCQHWQRCVHLPRAGVRTAILMTPIKGCK